MATSREAELESPPPRGTELTTTALKPGRGEAAGERMVLIRWGAGSVDVGRTLVSPNCRPQEAHPPFLCYPLTLLA